LGLRDWIAEQRDRQILANARPHLDDGEEVLQWARVRDPDDRKQGYAYVTDRRYIVHWSGRSDGRTTVVWDEIVSWGVDHDASKGPLLGTQHESGKVFVILPAGSRHGADEVSRFLECFEERAPRPARRLYKEGHEGSFVAGSDHPVSPEPRSVAGQTRRLLVLVLGLLLILAGVIIAPLPGPWSLPVVLAGLALLASEFDWAQDVLNWTREKYHRLRSRRSTT
jgi:Putative transmembrane protein (PGPGW)